MRFGRELRSLKGIGYAGLLGAVGGGAVANAMGGDITDGATTGLKTGLGIGAAAYGMSALRMGLARRAGPAALSGLESRLGSARGPFARTAIRNQMGDIQHEMNTARLGVGLGGLGLAGVGGAGMTYATLPSNTPQRRRR